MSIVRQCQDIPCVTCELCVSQWREFRFLYLLGCDTAYTCMWYQDTLKLEATCWYASTRLHGVMTQNTTIWISFRVDLLLQRCYSRHCPKLEQRIFLMSDTFRSQLPFVSEDCLPYLQPHDVPRLYEESLLYVSIFVDPSLAGKSRKKLHLLQNTDLWVF